MRLLIDELPLPSLGRRRAVRVLLPSSFEKEPRRPRPVLYFQDGHNLFDPATATYGESWRIPESLAALEEAGRPFEGIVVGVDCNHEGEKRLDEYSPWINPDIGKQLSRADGLASAGGEGQAYLDFLVGTLLPWVEGEFGAGRGRRWTAVGGSSMGSIISLYAGLSHPDLFGVVGCFSPAVWFARKDIHAFIRERAPALGGQWPAVYVDIGTGETSDASKPAFPGIYEKDARELAAALVTAGLPPERSRLVVEIGAEHSERAWARRFPGFLEWARSLIEA
jgi:predicted alpha/beta superfamily hydrolase